MPQHVAVFTNPGKRSDADVESVGDQAETREKPQDERDRQSDDPSNHPYQQRQ